MKKSRSIRLVLLGGASAVLAACDDGSGFSQGSEGARFYQTVSECSAEYGAGPCEAAKVEADKTQVAEAPRFNRKEQCEQEFGAGNCESHQQAGGGSFFMPMMMGYMMGNMMGGNGLFSRPVYRGPGNTAVMPNGGRMVNVGAFDGPGGAGNRAAFRPAAQATDVTRGGFGSTARSYSGTAGG